MTSGYFALRGLLVASSTAALFWTAAARADNQTPDITLPNTSYTLPYNLGLAVDDFGATPMPTLQSFAGAQVNGDWVMLGGRTNGLHGFTGSGTTNFPPADQNHDIWIVDPVTKKSWSRSLDGSGLPVALIDALSSTAQESMQVGNKLYVVGGYGFDTTTNGFLTYDTLTSIDLNGLMAWVKGSASAPPITSIFRSIQDPSLQVTGGELSDVDGRAMLVFGQNFDGDYNPGANGHYTDQVRSFDIVDTGKSLSITHLSASPADESIYRRRDYNLIDIMHSDPATGALSEGLVALGGVFTSTGGAWTVPVTVGADGVPHMADPAAADTLKMGLNLYASASFSTFSQVTGVNYATLFGGISGGTFDPATNTFSPDAELPFNNVITTIVIDKNGKLSQDLMTTQFPTLLSQTVNPGNPLLFGASARFFAAAGIPQFDNGVIDLDAVMAEATADSITLGYVFGGIASTLPNTNSSADSMGSNIVFTVTIDLPPLIDVKTAGTTASGTADVGRRLLIENAGAKYVIPAGSNVLAYGGGTVQSGLFDVNGTFQGRDLLVGAGGTLRGTGVIDAATTVAGTLRPGNSPGTLTFTHSVVQNAGSTLMLDIDGTGTGTGAGNYARVLVTGPSSTYTAGGTIAPVLRGLTGSATNSFSPTLGEHFTVVSAEGGVNGMFSSLTEPTSGLAVGTRFDVFYNATSIDLVVTPLSYAHLDALGGHDTHNRSAAGTGIDGLRGAPGNVATGDAGVVLNAVYGVPVADIGSSLDQIAGAVNSDALVAASSLTRLFTSAIHTGGNDSGVVASLIGGLPQGDFAALNAPASVTPAQASSASPFWAHAVGQWTTIGGDGNAPGNRDSAGGIVAGFDLIRAPGRALGIAGGYAVSDVRTKDAASADIKATQIIFYGSFTEGPWRFDENLAAGSSHFKTKRFIAIGALTRTANGDTDGWSASGDLTVHYGDGAIVPFGAFQYDYVSRDAFGETGAGALSLDVQRSHLSTPRLLAGGDADLNRLFGDIGVDLAAKLAWVHDFGGTVGRTDAALNGAPLAGFSVLSSRVGRDAVLADLRAAKTISETLSVFAEYGIEARSRATSQTVSAGLLVRF